MSNEITSEYLRFVESLAGTYKEAERQAKNLTNTINELNAVMKNLSSIAKDSSNGTTKFTESFKSLGPSVVDTVKAFVDYRKSIELVSTANAKHFSNIVKAQAASNDLTKATSTLKGGLIDLGVALAAMAINAVIDQYKKFKERQDDLNKATQNLRDTFPSISSGFEDAGKKATNATGGFASFKKHVEDLIKSHGELIESFKDTYQGIQDDSEIVGYYLKTIEELTSAETLLKNKGELRFEQQVELQQAVYALNKLCGMNIEITNLATGSLSMSTDAIKLNTEALMNNAKQQALQQQVLDTYRQQLIYQRELEIAIKAEADIREEHRRLEEQEKDLTAWQIQALDDARAEVKRLTAAYDGCTEQLEWYNGQMIKNNSAMVNSGSSIHHYISSIASVSDLLIEAGVDTEGFAQHLSNLGITTKQVKEISEENLLKMALSWSDNAFSMFEAADEIGLRIPNSIAVGLAKGSPDVLAAMNDLREVGIKDPVLLIPDLMSLSVEDGISAMESLLYEKRSDLAEAAESDADSMYRGMWKTTVGFTSIAKEAMTSMFTIIGDSDDVVDAATKTKDKTIAAISDFDTEKIGKDFTEGLGRGIGDGSALRFVVSQAEATVQAAINAVKNKADSHSPSRVMVREGKDFNAGIALGIEQSAEKVVLSTNNMMDAVIEKVTRSRANLSLDLFGKTNSAMNNAVLSPGTVVNIGDVSYVPDSRMAELMAEVMSILVRENNMRRVSYA